MIQPTNHPIREDEKMKEHKQKKRMLRSFLLLWERGKNNGWKQVKQLRKGNQASWQLRLPHLGHWKHPTSLVVCSFHNHVYTRCHPGLKPFITKPNQFYFVYSEFSFFYFISTSTYIVFYFLSSFDHDSDIERLSHMPTRIKI